MQDHVLNHEGVKKWVSKPRVTRERHCACRRAFEKV